MSRLLASIALASTVFTSTLVHAAPDNSPANMVAGTYMLEKTHASINAKVMHQGFAFYAFRFDKFDASFDYNPKEPTASKVVVTVDVKSMNTGLAKADKDFPVDFLAADKHPTATFKSTKISINQANKGTMAGDFTLGGVTKPIVLDVVFNGAGKDMFGAMRSGFSAKTTIKRSEFGLAKYVPSIGDDVALDIEVEFLKK